MNPQIDPQDGTRATSCAERIDQLCLAFEDAWQSGATPEISEYLAGWSGEERTRLLRELLLLEVEYVRQRGGEPKADDYFGRFAEEHSLIAEVFGLPAAETPMELSAGQRVGRYLVERPLGSGGFGRVYLAWDCELQRM